MKFNWIFDSFFCVFISFCVNVCMCFCFYIWCICLSRTVFIELFYWIKNYNFPHTFAIFYSIHWRYCKLKMRANTYTISLQFLLIIHWNNGKNVKRNKRENAIAKRFIYVSIIEWVLLNSFFRCQHISDYENHRQNDEKLHSNWKWKKNMTK